MKIISKFFFILEDSKRRGISLPGRVCELSKKIIKKLFRIFKINLSAKFVLSPKITLQVYKTTLPAFQSFTILDQESVEEMKNFLLLTRDKVCLLDIGALYGIFSLAFTYGNPGKMAYALEPSPGPFQILKGHIRLNHNVNIKPFQLALNHQQGMLKMEYDWVHLVATDENASLGKYFMEVRATTLDSFIIKHTIIPDVVKIDTEGSEFSIISGGEQFFKKHNSLIFLEIHMDFLKTHGISVSQLKELIYFFGYKIYDLRCNVINDLSSFVSVNPTCRRVVCSKSPLHRAI